MNDATNHEALDRAHHHLAADLAKVGQFIEPQNQQALAMLYRTQRRLGDIDELASRMERGGTATTERPGLDLEKLAQSIQALSKSVYSIDPKTIEDAAPLLEAHGHLHALEDLAKLAGKPSGENIVDAPKGLVGFFPDDTLAHVSDVLVVLSRLDYEDCGGSNDFRCGMIRILNCAMEALEYETGRVEVLRKAAKEAPGEGAAH